jgi:hypothetical protein
MPIPSHRGSVTGDLDETNYSGLTFVCILYTLHIQSLNKMNVKRKDEQILKKGDFACCFCKEFLCPFFDFMVKSKAPIAERFNIVLKSSIC